MTKKCQQRASNNPITVLTSFIHAVVHAGNSKTLNISAILFKFVRTAVFDSDNI